MLDPWRKYFAEQRSIQIITLYFLYRTYSGNFSGTEECRNLLYKYHQIPGSTLQHNRRLKKAGIITKYVHDQRQKINRKTLIGFHMPELIRELIL